MRVFKSSAQQDIWNCSMKFANILSLCRMLNLTDGSYTAGIIHTKRRKKKTYFCRNRPCHNSKISYQKVWYAETKQWWQSWLFLLQNSNRTVQWIHTRTHTHTPVNNIKFEKESWFSQCNVSSLYTHRWLCCSADKTEGATSSWKKKTK